MSESATGTTSGVAAAAVPSQAQAITEAVKQDVRPAEELLRKLGDAIKEAAAASAGVYDSLPGGLVLYDSNALPGELKWAQRALADLETAYGDVQRRAPHLLQAYKVKVKDLKTTLQGLRAQC